MLSVQSRARRLRPAALPVAVLAAACFATQASAITYPPSGLRFFAEAGVRPPSRTLITVETIRGSLSYLSVRAVRDVGVTVTRSMEGKVVGHITVGTGKKNLVMPRGASSLSGSRRNIVLSKHPTVVLHAVPIKGFSGGPVLLSVRELPPASTSFSLLLDGAGLGLIGVPHDCPVRPKMLLYAARRGAAPVSVVSGETCGTPPNGS